jgi:hypothetical protein
MAESKNVSEGACLTGRLVDAAKIRNWPVSYKINHGTVT